MKLFIHSTFSQNRSLYWPGPNIDTGGEFGVAGVAAPQWAGLARGRTISNSSERKTDSPLNSVVQERFVSDLMVFLATVQPMDPMVEATRTVKRPWDGILRWFNSRIANGLIEGINSLVQAAKAKARGYRSTRNLKAIVYLLAGKLDLELPA